MKKIIDKIRHYQELDSMPIKTLDKNCKYYGYRVELWKYGQKRGLLSDYRNRNKVVLKNEDW